MTKFIVHRQNEGDGCDNVGLTDDDGHPLVVVVGLSIYYPSIAPKSVHSPEISVQRALCDNCRG